MNCLLSILLTAILCATASAQTIKTLGYNTNGQVVANTGTNFLTFTNHVAFSASDITTYGGGISSFGVSLNFEERRLQDVAITNDIFNWASGEYVELGLPLAFVSTTNAATTRGNIGFSTNLNTLWTATNASNARSAVGLGATWLTNTNVTNFRTAVGLGTNAQVVFDGASITGDLFAGALEVAAGSNGTAVTSSGLEFAGVSAATTRTNLGIPLAALTNTSNVTMLRALAGSTNTNQPFSGTITFQDFSDNTHTVSISNGVVISYTGP